MADTADLREESRDGKSTAEAFLEVARQAAAAGRPDRMLAALVASRYLDGLTRRLENDWRGRLPRSEIEDCVAIAVDGAYDAVAHGRLVRNLGAWIWKVASNKAIDRWTDDYQLRAVMESDTLSDSRADPEIDSDSAQRLAEYRAKEASRVARLLLPRIGQGQIVDVMTMVIDAVEQGLEDLSPSAIGETLALSASAVRSLLSRGFERLEREARREGITLPEAVPGIVRDDDSEDCEEL